MRNTLDYKTRASVVSNMLCAFVSGVGLEVRALQGTLACICSLLGWLLTTAPHIVVETVSPLPRACYILPAWGDFPFLFCFTVYHSLLNHEA